MNEDFDNDIHGITLLLNNAHLPRLAERVALLVEAVKAAQPVVATQAATLRKENRTEWADDVRKAREAIAKALG